MQIKLCSLKSYPQLKVLLSELGMTLNQQKKYLKPSILNRIVKKAEEIVLPIDLINQNIINPNYNGEEVDILFKDQNFIVFNKPVRIHNHPLKYTDENNVLSFLRKNGDFKILSINQSQYDRGLLHRLDYETSGILVGANNEDVYLDITENRDEFITNKIYLAVVKNGLEDGCYQHTANFSQAKKIKPCDDGKTVDIKVECILKSDRYSLMAINLKQGHRHQIRFQLSALGFPIVGDSLYGGEGFDRLCLHSFRYEITYKEKCYKWQSLPEQLMLNFFDLNSCLEVISNKIW